MPQRPLRAAVLTCTAAALALSVAAPVAALPAAAPVAAHPGDRPGVPTPGAPRPLPTVAPVRETPTAFDDEAGGDADADDPAIWVHPTRPERSLVLGALKNGGLAVYDLGGRLLQTVDVPPAPAEGLEEGRFNNVDLALGVRTATGPVDLAVVSDRGRDRLRTYRIDPRGASAGSAVLTDVTAPDAPRVFSATEADVEEQATAYGIATAVERGVAHVVASRRHETELALLRLVPTRDGRFGYTEESRTSLPSSFRLPDGSTWAPCEDPGERPQVEGMVVDAAHGVLYAAQEDVGVWRVDLRTGARPGFGAARLVDRVREFGVPAAYDEASEECVVQGPDRGFGGDHLSADAEGLTIAAGRGGGGLLLVSSQGDSTFAAYERTGLSRYVGGFVVGDAGGVDGVQHSDGAAVVTVPVGPDFPAGLLVVHDGQETPAVPGEDGEPRVGTDFTLVRWDAVRAVLPRR